MPWLLLLYLSLPVAAGPLPLDALLAAQADGPAVLAAEAEAEALIAEAELRDHEAGWQTFAGASVGHYRELVSAGQRDSYYGRDLNLGVRHPLLGSLRRQADALAAVQQQHQRQRLRIALRRAEQRLALRSAYADWWRADQEGHRCGPLTARIEAATRSIDKRRVAGWLLASEAQLQNSRWQALGLRCAEAQRLRSETRDSLAVLVDDALPAAAEPIASPLAQAPQPLDRWLALLEQHPRLAEQSNRLSEAERQRESPWYSAVESTLSLAHSLEDRSGGSSLGSGLVASLSFSAPFDLVGYDHSRRRVAEARYQAASQQLEAQRRGLHRELAQALNGQRASLDNLERRRAQLQSAELAWQERQARERMGVEEDGLRTLNAEYEYQLAALELIAAWHAVWLGEASLYLFGDETPLFTGRQEWQMSGLVPVAESAWTQGAYVWDSYALLDPARRSAELSALRRAGMQSIYLGLDARQVRRLPQTRIALAELLEQARAQGLAVSLLLGDPEWLKAEGRGGLLELIGNLADLPFAGLHLDLEVEQLGWPVPDSRLQDWLDTLRAVATINPWPLAISSHHRWFAAPEGDHPCVPCALPSVGVSSVSLMIYTRNTARSAELSGAIAQRWPALRFRLAQSVEPQLPAEESWAGSSRKVLRQQVSAWRKQLAPLGLTGIDWQAWRDFPKR